MKVVSLQSAGKQFRLVGLGLTSIPNNSWSTTELKNQEAIATAIESVRQQSKPHPIASRQIVVALPESVIFSSSFATPRLTPTELAQALPYEIAYKLSIDLESHYLDYETVSSQCRPVEQLALSPKKTAKRVDQIATAAPTSDQVMVFAVAAKRSLIDSIVQMCDRHNLELVGIDIKPGAIARAIIPNDDQKIRLVVDLGAYTTAISIIEGQSVRLVSSLALGIDSVSKTGRASSQDIQANYGPVFDEIVHASKYFENRLCPNISLSEIVLIGGGSNISGIERIFQEQVGVPTRLGNPFQLVTTGRYTIKADVARTMADAVGLAMRRTT